MLGMLENGVSSREKKDIYLSLNAKRYTEHNGSRYLQKKAVLVQTSSANENNEERRFGLAAIKTDVMQGFSCTHYLY